MNLLAFLCQFRSELNRLAHHSHERAEASGIAAALHLSLHQFYQITSQEDTPRPSAASS